MKVSAAVEMRLENVIYKCGLCEKYRNNASERAHAVSEIKRLQINGNNANVELVTLMVCPSCFKAWDFKDPSQIVVPAFTPPADLRGGKP